MKLIPQETFTIDTSMSAPEVKERMMKHAEPKKWLRLFSAECKFFQGECSDSGFKLSRIISYRNSFLPIINGKFEEGVNGMKINISISLHPLVIAFMLLWFVGLGMTCLGLLFNFITSPTNSRPAFVVPVGFLLFGWGLMWIGFWPEVRKAKEKLNLIFKNNS